MRQIKSYDDMFHVECKITQDNDCLFSSFKEKGKYCMSFKKVCTRLDVNHSIQCNFSRGDGNRVGVWGEG